MRKTIGFFGAAAVVLFGARFGSSGLDSMQLASDIGYDVVRSGGELFQDFDPSLAGPTGSPDPALVGRCEPPALAPGSHRIELEHDGMRRAYRVHVPARASSGPMPVVVSLHGRGSNAWQQELVTGMSRLADFEGFVVVYPESLDGTWNGGTCCSDTPRDDVGFVRAVLADVARRSCVDADRTYVTGMSNGGYMAYRLVCEAPDLFAAAAPVAAHLGLPERDAPGFKQFRCDAADAIPIAHFHGTADDRVEYDLSPGAVAHPNTGAPDSVAYFAERYGCAAEPVATERVGASDVCVTYGSCAGGSEVVLCSSEGGGHCWPGNPVCWGYGEPMPELNASQRMWEFFRPKVRRPAQAPSPRHPT